MGKKTVRDPFKTMYKGVTSFKKKDGMHRPEGAGNFDNMDDMVMERQEIENSVDNILTLDGAVLTLDGNVLVE